MLSLIASDLTVLKTRLAIQNRLKGTNTKVAHIRVSYPLYREISGDENLTTLCNLVQYYNEDEDVCDLLLLSGVSVQPHENVDNYVFELSDGSFVHAFPR